MAQPKLAITKRPYLHQLLNSFIQDVNHKRGPLYNPIKGTTVRNTAKNRESLQRQINKHNDNLFNKVADYIEVKHNKHALNKFFTSYKYNNTHNAKNFDFLTEPKYKTIEIIKRLLIKQLSIHSFRCYLTIYIDFTKEDFDEILHYQIHLGLPTVNILNSNDINSYMGSLLPKLEEKFENANDKLKGSGWKLNKIDFVQVNIIKYEPTVGGSYIPTPKALAEKKAIINPRNEDDKCFMWALLAGLYPVSKNGERISNYSKYIDLFDWTCVSFPTTIDQIEKFEEKHSDLSINVYYYNNDKILPMRLSKSVKVDKHINLLLLEDGEKSHYTLIKNYSRLISSQLRNHHGAIYPCYYCNKPCTSKDILNRHMENCQVMTTDHTATPVMPETGKNDILKFKNHTNKFKVPFALVADFEAILPHSDPNTKNKIQDHLPCSFGINMITDFKEHLLPPKFYLGTSPEDTMENFYNALEYYRQHVRNILNRNTPMIMTDEDKKHHMNTNICHICEQDIPTGMIDFYNPKTKETKRVPAKVRDHCHITGKYRGAAHYGCNINFNYKDFKLPVIIHNLKNYDAHFIIQYYKGKTYTKIDKKTGKTVEKEIPIKVIANNEEKYMTFQIGGLRFIDSFQFLSSSLETLSDNLKKNGYDDFKYTKQYMGDHWKIACEKGIYPYEYMNSFDRFNETQLPPIEKFFSSLNESNISPEDYERAKMVWNTLDMKTLKDYHDFYLKCDVFLLSDVFDTFRNTMLGSHKLDPLHYITLPSFSWDAAMKHSKIELELLTDYEMLCMIEKGIRGGLSIVAHRHAKANNKYMSDYNPKEESSYIIYLDANNLYGVSMSQPLPYEGFKWNNNKFTVEQIMNNPAILNEDGNNGYMLEVDLEYPEGLHDEHNDLPLAPENKLIEIEMYSPWALNQHKTLKLLKNNTGKLTANVMNKSKYVVHYKNLQYYLEHGMKLTNIHRIIEFKEKAWLKEYIDVNTKHRALAKSDFEKDLFKLLNNSVFGKTMENIRGRIEYEIVQSQKRARSITQSAKFKSFTIINDGMVGVVSHKKEEIFNKPIYCGLAILDLSKLHMYKFHYDHMKPKYGENIKLCYQDTDSLIYHIKTEDLYKDMHETKEQYDFGSYPKNHFCYDSTNNKVIGKFKDETSGTPIIEWVGLAPKMYSIKLETGKEKGTAKGIKKSYYKNHIKHDSYVRCITSSKLEDMRQSATFLQFRSQAHQLSTYEINKYSLTNFDNKRYIIDDGNSSLAYGHYKIQQQ